MAASGLAIEGGNNDLGFGSRSPPLNSRPLITQNHCMLKTGFEWVGSGSGMQMHGIVFC
jgi:hypothetical protein